MWIDWVNRWRYYPSQTDVCVNVNTAQWEGFSPAGTQMTEKVFPTGIPIWGELESPKMGKGGAYHLGVSIPSLRGGAVMAASNPFHLLSKQGTGCQDRDVHRELPGSHCLTRTRLLFFLSFFPGGAGNQAQDSSRARSVLFQINVTLGLSRLHVKAQGRSLLLRILPFPELPGYCHELRVPFLSVSLAHLWAAHMSRN